MCTNLHLGEKSWQQQFPYAQHGVCICAHGSKTRVSYNLANWRVDLLQVGLQTSAPFLTGLPDNSYTLMAAATISLEAALIFGLQAQCA